MAVVGGLLLIVGAIIICIVDVIVCKQFGNKLQFLRRPRRELSEAVAIPMHVTAASGVSRRDNNDAADVATAKDDSPAADDILESPNNNFYSELQQPFAPIAGAVGGVGNDDVWSSEPFAMY